MLIVRARSYTIALPVEHVGEHLRPLPVEAVRGAPAYMLGTSRIRGEAIPVMDLGWFLVGTPSTAPARWVTVRAGDRRVALAVDAVDGVQTARPQHLGALPTLLQGAQSDAVAALGVLDGSLFLVLRASRLIEACDTADGSAG